MGSSDQFEDPSRGKVNFGFGGDNSEETRGGFSAPGKAVGGGSTFSRSKSFTARRECIVDAAVNLIRRLGQAKVSMEDIAVEVGTGRANLYRWFPAKEALENEVCMRLGAASVESIQSVIGVEDSPTIQLRDILTKIGQETASRKLSEPNLNEIFLIAFEKKWKAADAYIESILALIEKIIWRGVEAGEFTSRDPQQSSRSILMSMMVFAHPGLSDNLGYKTQKLMVDLSAHVEWIISLLQCRGKPEA